MVTKASATKTKPLPKAKAAPSTKRIVRTTKGDVEYPVPRGKAPPLVKGESVSAMLKKAVVAAEAARYPQATEIPGIFLNRYGYKVNEKGFLLPLREVQALETRRTEDVLGEEKTNSPAQALRRWALDPTLPMHTRMAAAIAAAPYFDRKTPTAVEGSNPNEPVKVETSVTIKSLNALQPAERKAALSLLEKLGLLGDTP